jgi:uncharacterized protein with beta-barrel porin domain
MKPQSTNENSSSNSGSGLRSGYGLARLFAGTVLFAAATLPAAAQNATWLISPGSGDFNTATNWTPATVPTGTAFFGFSNTTALSFSANTTVGGWTFNAGASAYSFTNGQTLDFTGAGIAVNGGSASITNNLVLQFSNASTAGNATITNNNVLQFLDNSTAGGAVITNTSGLSFNNASTAGNAHITNSGGLVFFSTSTAGNAVIINTGTLQFAAASTAGSAAITNNNVVQFLNTSTAGSASITNNNGLAFFNASTAGNAAITNSGNLTFFNTSTAGNAALINNGVLQFANTSTAGSATITNNNVVQFLNASTASSAVITNNGGLSFNNTSTGGNAAITNNSGGVVDFSPSTGPNNDGKLSAGSIAGAGSYYLGARQLTVGGNNLSTVVSGVISDCGPTGTQCTAAGATGGALVKIGTGTLTLNGVDTYTGGTTDNAGTLAGTGTIGNTLINSGATFAPGSGAAGTFMTVNGSLAFASGALYLVQINPAAASLANATTATLTGGNVQAMFAAGSYAGRQYTILHTAAAGGLGGTQFSGVSSNVPGFGVSLSYPNNQDVILNLTGALGAGTTLSQNQQNVATALNTFFNNGGTLPPNFFGVFGLTGGNLANALTQLSGEAATGAQQGAFQLTGQFLGLMLDPFVDGRSGTGGPNGPALGFAPEREALPEDIALAYAKVTKAPVYNAPPVTFEQRWTAWAGAYGGYNTTSGDPVVVGSHDLTARAAGVATGLDYHVTRDTVVGFALAGGGTKWDLAQGLGGGKSDAFQAGVYGATRSGPAYLAASFAFTNHWMSTDRFAAFADHLTASFNAQSIGGRVEGGYRFGMPAGGITPYAAVQAQSFRTPTYSETDLTNGGFGLTYNGRTATDTRSELGARFDHVALVDPTAVLTVRGRLAWAHDWITDPTLAAVFQALPGASFIVNGATPAKDSALVSAGAELRLVNGVTLLAKFDGEFANRSSTYAGTGTVRVTW